MIYFAIFLLSGRYRVAVTLHDYYVVCPRVNMTKNGKYCYESCDNECNACMNDSLAEPSGDLECRISRFPDIVSWRKYWFEFLYKADYVFVPSSDQRKRLLRYFPSLTKIRVVENPEIVVPPDTCNVKFRKVGILGAISEAKGRSVLVERQVLLYDVVHISSTHPLLVVLFLPGSYLLLGY